MNSATFRMQLVLVAVMVGATALPANAAPWSRQNSVVVYGDRGGEVIRYALKAKKLIKSGKTLRIAGPCDSACTIYLSMPASRTCITPRASFGFHRAYGGSPRMNRVATRYMMKKYPAWVKRWIAANGGLTSQSKTMPYNYAAKYLPACDSINGVGT